MLKAHAKLTEKLGAGSRRTRSVAEKLVRFYEERGEPERAAAYREPDAS